MKMRQHLGAAFSAPKHTGIGKVADDPPYRSVMPGLAAPCLVPQPVQVGRDTLSAIAFVGIFIKDHTYYCGFILVDRKFEQLMFPFVQFTAFYKVIAIGGNAAAKTSSFYQLAVLVRMEVFSLSPSACQNRM